MVPVFMCQKHLNATKLKISVKFPSWLVFPSPEVPRNFLREIIVL